MDEYKPTFGGDGDEVGSIPSFLTPFVEPDSSDNGSGAGGTGGNDSNTGKRDANGVDYDPERHTGKLNADGTWRNKRGRKSNSSTTGSRKRADYSASVESLARMMGYLHMGIATATRTPELMLEPAEAQALAGATAKVMEEFDIRPSPKAEAIVGLVVTAAGIYTPRAYFIRERLKKEAE